MKKTDSFTINPEPLKGPQTIKDIRYVESQEEQSEREEPKDVIGEGGFGLSEMIYYLSTYDLKLNEINSQDEL